MKKYVFIALGGVLGTYLRYYIKNISFNNYNQNIPINTLAINVIGSIILAVILTIAFDTHKIREDLRIGIATGFLGAFTTFSTLCKETVTLFIQGNYFSAIYYIAISTALGFMGAYLGILFTRQVILKYINNDTQSEVE